ncbi:MAG TPA: T9SS type A sorting domain-containing protein [Rhodothermales bacterium]
MRKCVTTTMAIVMGICLVTPLYAQNAGDFRTRDSGDWSSAQIWETYNGSAWGPTATAPTGSESITIVATEERSDSVFVDAPITITGTLINQGMVEANGNLTFGDGGTYQHDRDAGEIPISTWEEGSTLLLTGVESTAPDNRRQNYHNIVFNTPDLLSNLNMDLDSVTVSGDVHIIDTGLARWYLTSALATEGSTVEILGDVIQDGGNFAVQGTSNAQTTFVVDHYGDIIVNGGNFSISRGSQGGGTTTWNLHGGDFTMSNATTQSSTATIGGAQFVFMSGTTQTLTLGEGNTITALPIEVAPGTTLDIGTSVLSGSGDFVVREGAGLATAHPGGVAAIFDGLYVGADTLAENSSYVFNGTEAQVTSELMPTVVQDLTIDNAAGVTLSQETTINGVLRLQAGVFDNSIPFTLGPSGSVSEEGGSLSEGVASESEREIPQTIFVDQNYPNPFNPATTIRYGLPAAGDVMLRLFNVLGQEVRSVALGNQAAGVHEFTLDARGLTSGVYVYRVEAGEFSASKRMILVE